MSNPSTTIARLVGLVEYLATWSPLTDLELPTTCAIPPDEVVHTSVAGANSRVALAALLTAEQLRGHSSEEGNAVVAVNDPIKLGAAAVGGRPWTGGAGRVSSSRRVRSLTVSKSPRAVAGYCLSKTCVFLTVCPFALTPVVATVNVLPSGDTLTPLTRVRLPACLLVVLTAFALMRFRMTTSASG